MKTLIAAALLTGAFLVAPAAAQCISDLDGIEYDTRGECEAALARKRNDIRRSIGEPALSPMVNDFVRENFTCVNEGGFWQVKSTGA